MGRILDAILDWILPRGCPACRRPWPSGGGVFCHECEGALDACRAVGLTAPDLGRAVLCRGPFRYDGMARELVCRMKYGRDRVLASALGRVLAVEVGHAGLPGGLDAVVPVPLERRRLRERGFNQACELARPVAQRARLPLREGALARRPGTRRQAGLDAGARRSNAALAFEARAPARDLRRVLLVDDVVTTGSTLRACARALVHAGVAEVHAVVFAVSPPPPGRESMRGECAGAHRTDGS